MFEIDLYCICVLLIANMAKYDMKNIPTFSGESSENGEMFLRRFETYASLKGFTNEKKLYAFELSLHGKAAGWHFCLANKSDWAVVSKKFKEKFGYGSSGDEINWEAESKLYALAQGPNERAGDFFVRVSTVAGAMKKPDVEQVRIVVRGLESNVRAFVLSKEPKNMEEVEGFIKLYESISTTAVCPGVSHTVQHVDGSEMKTLIEKVEMLQSEVAELRSCQSPCYEMNKGTQLPSQRSFRSMNKIPKNVRGGFKNKSRVICFRCSKEGHRASDCFSKYHKNGTYLGDNVRDGRYLNDNGRH